MKFFLSLLGNTGTVKVQQQQPREKLAFYHREGSHEAWMMMMMMHFNSIFFSASLLTHQNLNKWVERIAFDSISTWCIVEIPCKREKATLNNLQDHVCVMIMKWKMDGPLGWNMIGAWWTLRKNVVVDIKINVKHFHFTLLAYSHHDHQKNERTGAS